MAYGFVQQVSNVTGTAPGITPGSGNALIGFLVCANTGTTSITVTDTLGNTWISSTAVVTGDGSANTFYFYALNVFGGATTITAGPNAGSITQYYVAEYSGLQSFLNSASNVQSTAPGPGTDAVTSTVANATSQPAAVIGFSIDGDPNASALNPGTSFTARPTVWATGNPGYPEDRRVTVTGNVAATWTATSGSGEFNRFNSFGLIFSESGASTNSATIAWTT